MGRVSEYVWIVTKKRFYKKDVKRCTHLTIEPDEVRAARKQIRENNKKFKHLWKGK